MLKLLLTCSLLFTCIWVQAQPWHPFPLDQTTYYAVSKSNEVIGLKLDSSRTDTNNVVFSYFNTRAEHACSANLYEFAINELNVDYAFLINEYDTFTFIIENKYDGQPITEINVYPQLLKGQSVKKKNTIITCNNTYVGVYLGVGDSIKEYTYVTGNDTDQVLLSRSHGLLEFPGYEIQGYNTKTDTIGFRSPELNDYFTIQPGDLIQRLYSETIGSVTTKKDYYLDSIVQVNWSNDTVEIVYDRYGVHKIKLIPDTAAQTQFTSHRTINVNQKFIQKNKKLSFVKSDYSDLQATPTNQAGTFLIDHYLGYTHKIGIKLPYVPEKDLLDQEYYFDRFEFQSNNYQDTGKCNYYREQIADSYDYYRYNSLFGLYSYESYIYSEGDIINGQESSGGSWWNNNVVGFRLGGRTFGNIHLSSNENALKESDNNISLFPNPTHSKLSVRGLSAGKYHIQIFTSTGQLLMTDQFSPEDDINVESLKPGMYFLRIYSSTFSDTRKFVLK